MYTLTCSNSRGIGVCCISERFCHCLVDSFTILISSGSESLDVSANIDFNKVNEGFSTSSVSSLAFYSEIYRVCYQLTIVTTDCMITLCKSALA